MYFIFAGEFVLQSEQWDCCDSTLTCSRDGELHLSGIQGQHISINSGVNYTEEDDLRSDMTHQIHTCKYLASGNHFENYTSSTRKRQMTIMRKDIMGGAVTAVVGGQVGRGGVKRTGWRGLKFQSLWLDDRGWGFRRNPSAGVRCVLMQAAGLMWQPCIPNGHTRYIWLSKGPRTKFRHLPGSHVVDHFISWALDLNWWQVCDRMKVNMQCWFLWWEKQANGEKSKSVNHDQKHEC